MIELIEEPAYRHVLLTHVPVIGMAVAWVVLVIGIVSRERSSLLGGLALVALTAGSTLLVIRAGNDAYPSTFGKLDGDGRAWLDHHTYLADSWGTVLYVNAALAALAMGLGAWRPAVLRRCAMGVAATTLASLVAAAVIAETGGKIKHPEFRFTYPPIHDESPRPRSNARGEPTRGDAS